MKVRSLKYTIPILVYVNESVTAPAEFWGLGSSALNRTLVSSSPTVLLEYSKCNVNLTWAPEMRTGRYCSLPFIHLLYSRLYSAGTLPTGLELLPLLMFKHKGFFCAVFYFWKTLTIILDNVKPGDAYLTFTLGDQFYKTEIAKKEPNPRWAPLAYL